MEKMSFFGSLQGPYVNGSKPSAVDFNLAPKLFHLDVVLGHFKKWGLPDELLHVRDYFEVGLTLTFR